MEFGFIYADTLGHGEFKQHVQIHIDLNNPPMIGDPYESSFNIPFQFPPIITQDSKKISWKSHQQKFSEPVVSYDGADARTIQLKWEYVAVENKDWTAEKIRKVLSNLKAYYYRSYDAFSKLNISGAGEYGIENMPLIKITRFYDYAFTEKGINPSYWRSSGITITPKDRLICIRSRSGGLPERLFPLVTEVSMDLLLVSEIFAVDEKTGKMDEDGEEIVQKQQTDVKRIVAEWY